MSPREGWSRVWAALGLARGAGVHRMLALAGIGAVLGAAPVAIAWLTKVVFDGISTGRDIRDLTPPAVALAVAGAAVGLLPQLQRFLEAEFNRSLALRIRASLHSVVNAYTGISKLEDPRFQDSLRMAAQGGQGGPAQVVTCLLGLVQSAVMFAGFVGSLLVLSPWMLVVIVVGALPTLWGELVISQRRAEVVTGLSHAQRREIFYSQLLTGVTAAKEIRLFGLSDFFGRRMFRELRHINAENRALDLRDARIHGGLAMLAAIVGGAGLLWAVGSAAGGGLTVGDVAVFAAAVAGAQGALSTMVNYFGQVHHAMLLFAQYQAVVQTEPDLPVARDCGPVPALTDRIEFRDVWFRYDDGHPWVLRGLDLTIHAGRSTALVGVNGAGKSTLVKLLCRFYDPVKGSIHWDGADIRELDPADLRRRMGAVFQDFMSYELSAGENIAVGDLDQADEARLRRAAADAGIAPVLDRLPHGLDTMLTRTFFNSDDLEDPETGVILSGGQWQRLALARALMRDERDLLILDEPSSGLDADAEHEIHESLRRLRAGRTSLLISHRLSTLRDADVIAVLDAGVVVESGNHDDLCAFGGVYARLFGKQAQGYRDVPQRSAVR